MPACTGTSATRPQAGLRQPDHHEAQAYHHVLVRLAPSRYLCRPEWQAAHAISHCTDDSVRLLRHAALALCLAPGPV